MISALASLRTSLAEGMTQPLRGLEHDMKDIDREIEKTRKWLGDRGAATPPRDASRTALREFLRARELPNLRSAILASFACAEPIDDRKYGIIGDQDMFMSFLKAIDEYKNHPRALRPCYRGLLSAYFGYDVDKALEPGRENWTRLRKYLRDRAGAIEAPGLQPTWVETLKVNPQLLDDDPGAYFGEQIFRGKPEKFDAARTGLSIGDQSWLVWQVVLGQIEAAIRQPDVAFRDSIPTVLKLLKKHPLARNFGLAKVLNRYRECTAPVLNEALRDDAVDAWGNPWLSLNTAKWSLVRDAAREMVASWLKLALIRKFFGLLADDGMNDTRRLKFWESYHHSIHSMHFALGNTALHHSGADFKETRKQMEGLMMSLVAAGSPDNNAFIMGIGDHVVVEFGLKGNACFIFKRENLPFPLFGAVAGNSDALKHPRKVARLRHDDGAEIWESKFRRTLLDVVKVRPAAQAPDGRSGAVPPRTIPTPPAPPLAPPPPRAAQPDFSRLRPQVADLAGAAFSMEALTKFCGTHRLAMNDFRDKGGNLRIITDAANSAVNDQLTAWGFKFKKPNYWWLQ